MVDRFTKVVLTVIAVALVWLCLCGPGPRWGKPVAAKSDVVDVNIARVGGLSSIGGLPVRVQGPVEVQGKASAFSPLQPVEVKVVNRALVEVRGSGGSYEVPVVVRGIVKVR